MGAREQYQEVMEKQLNEWKAQAERFKASAAQMEAQARAQYDKNLELLHAKQEEAWEQFHTMKNASEAGWEQFKARMEKAGNEVKAAAERMSGQFRQ